MTTRNIYCRVCGAPLTAALYCNDCGTSVRDLRSAPASAHFAMQLRRRPRPRGLVAGVIGTLAIAMKRRRRRSRMRAAA